MRIPLPISRLLTASVLVLLCGTASGCPRKTTLPRGGTSATGKTGITPGKYPQPALDFLVEALKNPAAENQTPALVYTWTVIAQMNALTSAPNGAQVRSEVGRLMHEAGDNPPPELVAADLNCAPEVALQAIRDRARKMDWSLVGSLWFHPDLARDMLADPARRVVPASGINADLSKDWLDLQHSWNSVEPVDKNILQPISERNGEPNNTLRAAGWILRLEPENKRMLDYLTFGVTSAMKGKPGLMMAAAEGIKISHVAKFADTLVPVVANTPMAGSKGKTNSLEMYGAYALAYLSGDQASMMRKKLLNAQDGTIQWEARLGELLHGDAKPWDDAINKDGVKKPETWIALEALDSTPLELLPTFKKMAASDDASLRLRAANQLARYMDHADDAGLKETVLKLTTDSVPEVKAAAWYAAGKLGLGDPLPVLGDKAQTPEVRLAAAYAALMQAQGGPPQKAWLGGAK